MFAVNPLGLLRTFASWCTFRKSQGRYIFVCGAPRSGTTLLKAILENHSRTCGPDFESTVIFGKYDLYRDQTLSHIGLEKETIRSILANSNDVVSFYDDVAEAVCGSRGASVFVDKQPWPPRWYRLWYTAAKFEKARWIHLLRDGRDCYRSAQSHPYVPQSDDPGSFAKYWKSQVENHESMIPESRKLTVRYEDLTRSPAATTREIMRFVGLSYEPKQIDASSRENYDEGEEGVHSRLREPITDSSVGRWRQELDPEEVTNFHRYAADCLRRFGYDTS